MVEKYVVGMLFTNSYVISNNNECVIVDPGERYEAIANKIKEKYSVKAILLTHGHVDHIDGIKFFNCPIYIHKLDEEKLYNSYRSLYEMIDKKTPFKKGDLNVITVEDGDILKLIGYDFKVIYTPGHTNGSVCYYVNNELFSGDTLFNLSCGRTDFPSGDLSALNKSLKLLTKIIPRDTKIYPGHNDETTMGYEILNNNFLR